MCRHYRSVFRQSSGLPCVDSQDLEEKNVVIAKLLMLSCCVSL